MTNFRVVTSFQSWQASDTSEDATFPITNITSFPFHPFRPWKSLNNAGTVDLTFDSGSANTIAGLMADPTVFLDLVNTTSARIQANGSLSWGAPPWNQTIAIAVDPYSNRRKGLFRLADLSASVASYRYLNLRIDSQAPTSGTQYQIGTALIGTAIELLANPLYPVERQLLSHEQIVSFPDGGREVLQLGTPSTRFVYGVEAVGSAELSQGLLLDQLVTGFPFVVWDSVNSGPQYAWLVRQTELRRWVESELNQFRATWTLEEVV